MTTLKSNPPPSPAPQAAGNFIHEVIEADIQAGRVKPGHIITRFPPEPNGYLHIGHAKALCLDFGTALKYGGRCHLRMDDTNPAKEEQEYIDGIKNDVRWLGFSWGDHEYHASDYFDQLYDWAVLLIKNGKAYICDLSPEDMTRTRGTLTQPGQNGPFRDRSVEENLDLFARMKVGEFPEGTRTLRAKIDMASPNITMRDPVMYRILRAEHPRTGRKWSIYPMYDWAHGQSDWIEGVTHSLCDTGYEEHRPLYDWFLDTLIALGAKSPNATYRPRQYEFARLNIQYMMMSKRNLLTLVQNGVVSGWDDPRMPTLGGLRRRGFTADALKEFCQRIGVAKRENMVEIALLEHCLRDDLNKHALRAMAVMKPLKVVIDNYPQGQDEELEAVNNPEDVSAGTRKVPFGREIYIEREDFEEVPPPKFYRLFPGNEIRLRYAYLIRCVSVVKDASGQVTEVHCTYDPATRGGNAPDGRKVKSTIHWVSARHAVDVEARLYEQLFVREDPNDLTGLPAGADWRSNVNAKSLEIVTAKGERSLADAKPGERYQFERIAYFCVDTQDSSPGKPVFNRTVTLRDSWAKEQKKGG
ncbi:MAG: glutamine--tRNA ligase/YqeY domain fusion protein [Phycisphaeraceae bacterium]|nr:glutamine--tRNA ligase/YqeY domain fusion protein [Phycisphaeraceae bacterium]